MESKKDVDEVRAVWREWFTLDFCHERSTQLSLMQMEYMEIGSFYILDFSTIIKAMWGFFFFI